MAHTHKKRSIIIVIAIIMVALICSVLILELSFWDVFLAIPEVISFFVSRFLPPDFSNLAFYMPVIMDTVYFAITATSISTVFSFILAALMSERINPNQALRVITQGFTSFLI